MTRRPAKLLASILPEKEPPSGGLSKLRARLDFRHRLEHRISLAATCICLLATGSAWLIQLRLKSAEHYASWFEKSTAGIIHLLPGDVPRSDATRAAFQPDTGGMILVTEDDRVAIFQRVTL